MVSPDRCDWFPKFPLLRPKKVREDSVSPGYSHGSHPLLCLLAASKVATISWAKGGIQHVV